jgi:hypothetical protein
VTGQLLNSQFPEYTLNAVPILVSDRSGTTHLATTNEFGEFQGEVKIGGDFELRLPNPKGTDIIIPLGCLMADLAGSAEEAIEDGRR